MAKDYYDILGVGKTSNADEIKKAYRALAHKHHPDKKGGDEAKFKEINEAYQVLGNAEKRQQYDQFGSAAFQQGSAGGAGFNWQDFAQSQGFGRGGVEFDMSDLGDIFGNIFGFGGGGGRSRGSRRRKGSDIEADLEITFREAVFGVEKEVRLHKKVICDHCHGNGAQPGTKIVTCTTCGGSGQVHKTQQTILGAMNTVGPCARCQGEGKTNEQNCATCSGQGVMSATKELKVKIPAGISNGQTIRLDGQGEAGLKGAGAGDLFLTVHVPNDAVFKREADDLVTTVPISFSLASLGGSIEVQTLETPVKVKIPAGTESGKIFRLKAHGVPHLEHAGRGDLLVQVDIKVPSKLSRKQKKLLEELAAESGEKLENLTRGLW